MRRHFSSFSSIWHFFMWRPTCMLKVLLWSQRRTCYIRRKHLYLAGIENKFFDAKMPFFWLFSQNQKFVVFWLLKMVITFEQLNRFKKKLGQNSSFLVIFQFNLQMIDFHKLHFWVDLPNISDKLNTKCGYIHSSKCILLIPQSLGSTS